MTDQIIEPGDLYDEGWAFLDEAKFDQALEVGRRLERIRWTGGFELQAAVHEAKGDLDSAINVLKRGIDVAGGPYLLFNRLGNTLSDMERYQEALEIYEQGLALEDTNEVVLRMNRGLVFERMNDHERALAEYLSIIDEIEERRVDESTYWYFKSYHSSALVALGRFHDLTELIEPLSTAVFKSDEFSQPKAFLAADYAHALWKQKEIAPSNRWLGRAIDLDRNNSGAKWLVREQLLQENKPGGTLYHLTADGIWPASLSCELKELGVLACFEVVAPDPETALNYALKFVEASVAPSLRVEECKVLEPNSSESKGVYEVQPYIFYDLDGEEEGD